MYNKQKLSWEAIQIAEIAKISQNDLNTFTWRTLPVNVSGLRFTNLNY